jgi:hypothetical protein
MKRNSKFAAILAIVILIWSTIGVSASAWNISGASLPTIDDSIISDAIDIISEMTDGRTYIIEGIEYLYGFSEMPEYILITFEGQGYAIVNLLTGSLSEALPDGENPYTNVTGKAYYAGPLNYIYADENENFYTVSENHYISDAEISAKKDEIASIIEKELATNSTKSSVSNTTRATSGMVSYSSYIINTMLFGNNVNDTCGSVAAGMMLTCLDNKVYGIGNVVPLAQPYGESLHQSLIPYCEGPSGSTSDTIASGINDWLFLKSVQYENFNPSINAHYFYAVWGPFAHSSIDNNKTCVININGALGSPYGNHQVMAFGYYQLSPEEYFNVHLGYSGSGDSNAIINSSWGISVCYIT